MSKFSNVWVFSDTAARLPEVIAGGTALGEKVLAFVIGGQAEIVNAFAYGATEVYSLGEKDESKIVEDYVATMAQEIQKGQVPSLVLLPGSKRGKAVAAKLGAALNAGVINDASEVKIDNNAVLAKHMVFGGLALGEEKITTPIAIVTLSGGVFEPLSMDSSKTGVINTVAFVDSVSGIKCLERRHKQGGSVDLAKAKRVVGIGRGIAKQEDIKMVEELCAAIGAEMGCSRPIAEGEKWMERERYIGVSGVMLKPEIYMALGISGQIQHMVGANGSQVIVAINKDKNAPIFEFADYGIVGDIYKVVPALVAALKG